MYRARPPPNKSFLNPISHSQKQKQKENIMRLNTTLVGKVAQHKLINVPGKAPFLDVKIDVVIPTASGKEYTHWVTCKVWQGLAVETERQLSKGCMVEVSGRPEVKPFNRRDGSAGAELIVHAQEIRVVPTITTSDDEEN